jgi:uncharacterized membrane protein
MEQNMYRFYMRIALILVVLAVMALVYLEIYYLSIVVLLLAILGVYGLRRRVNVPVQDERTFRISEMASRRTIQIVGMVTGLGGVILVALSQSEFKELEPIGYFMAIFACALILCYTALFAYYRRRLGEFEHAE